MDKQLPNEISQLGEPIAEYGRSIGVLFGSILFILFGIGVVYANFAEPRKWVFWEVVIFIVISVFAFWTGITGLQKFIRNRKIRIFVFNEGLVEVNDTQTNNIRWDEIKTVSIDYTDDQSIESFVKPIFSIFTWVFGIAFFEKSPNYIIELNNGRKHTFTQEIRNHRKLGSTIIKEATTRLLPKAIESYDKNQTIAFGKFSVNQQGIVGEGKNNSWTDTKKITIAGHTASLDGTSTTILDSTPNYDVLLGLIDYAKSGTKIEHQKEPGYAAPIPAQIPTPISVSISVPIHLITDLQRGNERKRRAASYKLRNFKDSVAVTALIGAYGDKDSSVRQNVIDGLRTIRTQEALDFLNSHNIQSGQEEAQSPPVKSGVQQNNRFVSFMLILLILAVICSVVAVFSR